MPGNSDPNNDSALSASAGYPMGQLRQSLETAMRADDLRVRQRARERATIWEQVLAGIGSGSLQIGSRTPVGDTPAWVTLEVAHGGIATGRYLAEGPIEDWEQALLNGVPPEFHSALSPRHRLNTWYLSDDGMVQLQQMLTAQTYEIDVPEAGALPVVAWLAGNGFDDRALDLVADLYPLIGRLRFYPRPTERGAAGGAFYSLQTAGDVAYYLRNRKPSDQLTAMVETLTVWHPLLDRLVSLWLQTVEGEWPCRRWPDSWSADRTRWLSDYEEAAATHQLSRRHSRPHSNFLVLREALERCPADSQALTGRDVGRVRVALTRTVERWGTPGSDRHTATRRAQAAMAALPTYPQMSAVLTERLSQYPSRAGLPELGPVLAPVTIDDDQTAVQVPEYLAKKTERALETPVADLVDRGVIGSAEILSIRMLDIFSRVAVSGIENRELQALDGAIYQAFRRRRPLLPNLEDQVQIADLPWVHVLDRFRLPNPSLRATAEERLPKMAFLAISSFPHSVLTNLLILRFSVLASEAETDIPFIEGIAADNFSGTFTTEWRHAAHITAEHLEGTFTTEWRRAAYITAEHLEGTLYAKYYDLPPAATWASAAPYGGSLLERVKLRWGKHGSEDFAALCHDRAREAAAGDGSYVANKGAVIEQGQILTTHNLAPLVHQLGIAEQLAASAPGLVTQVFDWIIEEQTKSRDDWQATRHMLKNTAYAWRQAIYLLSLADEPTQQVVLGHMRHSWASGPDEWRSRFDPVLIGLEQISAGTRFDPAGQTNGGRRFLGWSVGPHWMLLPRDESH